MRIGEIAQKAHVSRSLIRYYEQTGILPRAARTSSGYREYGAADLARIQLVTGARRLGCSFAEIKALLDLQMTHDIPSADCLELLEHREIRVSEEMDRLRRVQMELSRLRELATELARSDVTISIRSTVK